MTTAANPASYQRALIIRNKLRSAEKLMAQLRAEIGGVFEHTDQDYDHMSDQLRDIHGSLRVAERALIQQVLAWEGWTNSREKMR
jgi:hypothetical protein